MTDKRDDESAQSDAAIAGPAPAAEPNAMPREATAGEDVSGAVAQAPADAAGPPPARRGSAWPAIGAAVLVVVIALAAVAATARWWGPSAAEWAGTASDARVAAVEGRLNRQQDESAQLAARLAAAERNLSAVRDTVAAAPAANAGDGEAVRDLAQRVARLEAAAAATERVDPQAIAELARDTERRSAEITRIGERVEALARNSADAATVLRLADRVDVAEAASREAAARRGSAQALLLAIGQLREAVNRGDPFAAELRAVAAVLGNDDAAADIGALARHGQRGIPTRTVLTSAFESLGGRIIRADLGPEEPGLWRQTVQRLASLVTVRRTEGDAAGGSAAAVTARAEQKLGAGDLAGAVAELGALEGSALEAAAPWMADAQARLTADKALSGLTARAVAMTARSEG